MTFHSSFAFAFFTKILDDQIMDSEMGGACSMYEGVYKGIQNFGWKL
jgi:hypothetical protein